MALVLFAVPLWYAWQSTVEQGRSEILSADVQRLSEVFRRGGSEGLKAFIDCQDCRPGGTSIAECERGVLKSRKAILILTP